jgi:FkbM family methyltransferase
MNLTPFQRLRRRIGCVIAFAATGEGWRDQLALALAGFARNRPFGGSSLYSRIGRQLTPQTPPRIAAAGGQMLDLDLGRVEELQIFEEIFVDRTYPVERVPFTPDVVIDCGAFCGMFTVLARARFHSAKFIAIEPEPANFRRLSRNLALNNATVETLPVAVGVAEGIVRFTGGGFGGHIVTEGEAGSSIEVRLISLAALLRQLKPERLVLKLDIEGAERDVLPDILPLLPPQTVIFLETHDEEEACQVYLRPCLEAGFNHELIRNRQPGDEHALFLERMLIRDRPVVRHFCTYFDSNYSAMGLSLHHSLLRHCPAFHLWILCLDDHCHELITRLGLPHVTVIALADFERGDEALCAAKRNRDTLEYYFTCTPSLPLYILRQQPGLDLITYLDSDLYFYSDPNPLFTQLGENSVAIVAHRFSPMMAHLVENGIYNVGWLSFRNDARGLACLQWWRERCLEWCYIRHEPRRYADQKYLDDWPRRFAAVAVLPGKGTNLGLWNVGQYVLSRRNGTIFVDEDPLIFFHFHGLRRPQSWLFRLSTSFYGVAASRPLLWDILIPYIQDVVAAERRDGGYCLPGPRFSTERLDSSLNARQKLRFAVGILANLFRRNSVAVVRGRIIALP